MLEVWVCACKQDLLPVEDAERTAEMRVVYDSEVLTVFTPPTH